MHTLESCYVIGFNFYIQILKKLDKDIREHYESIDCDKKMIFILDVF